MTDCAPMGMGAPQAPAHCDVSTLRRAHFTSTSTSTSTFTFTFTPRLECAAAARRRPHFFTRCRVSPRPPPPPAEARPPCLSSSAAYPSPAPWALHQSTLLNTLEGQLEHLRGG